ncbi:hypothetical protein BC826DRAFT_973297 [Russula brevipes]|nr:hypothetical protein BC826DRAFT_973297 [Russula brevipes]
MDLPLLKLQVIMGAGCWSGFCTMVGSGMLNKSRASESSDISGCMHGGMSCVIISAGTTPAIEEEDASLQWRAGRKMDNDFVVVACITKLMYDFNFDMDKITLTGGLGFQLSSPNLISIVKVQGKVQVVHGLGNLWCGQHTTHNTQLAPATHNTRHTVTALSSWQLLPGPAAPAAMCLHSDNCGVDTQCASRCNVVVAAAPWELRVFLVPTAMCLHSVAWCSCLTRVTQQRAGHHNVVMAAAPWEIHTFFMPTVIGWDLLSFCAAWQWHWKEWSCGNLGKYFECVSVKVGDMIQGIGTIAILAMGGSVGDLMCGVRPNTEDTMGIRVGDVIGGVGPNTETFMGSIIGDVIHGIGPNTEYTMGSSVGDVVRGIGPNTEIFMGSIIGDVIRGMDPTPNTMGSSVGDVVRGIRPNTEIFMGGSVSDVIHGVRPKTNITTSGLMMIAPRMKRLMANQKNGQDLTIVVYNTCRSEVMIGSL